ncbi:dammarenediol II synthase-like [Actinidia eriantha]|uniref:dammarenediol II synthase-like n=1 Tax=Actinidia eriantha TaxID=165200 RepID=UPI002590F4A3|nr:dammarenediol II synthase-like [Actinidia eriantha]
MCWWAENPNGDEFKHHLARVLDYLWLAEDGMKMQIKQNPNGDFESMYQQFTKGRWNFSEPDHGWIVSDCTAESLKSPDSGGFSAWEAPVSLPALEVLNPSEFFADVVVEKEHVECTTSVIQALLMFKHLHPKHREKEIDISVAKAIRFLEMSQWPDGSWYGYWGICFSI